LFSEGAESFVNELHRRWMPRRRGSAVTTTNIDSRAVRFMPPEREMPDHAIFVSYAREDLVAVQRLKAALDAAGFVTWFDMERLQGGDDFERKIQRNVSRCSYFIPIISATTQRRVEGWFRREWSWAVDRTRAMAEGATFILPVCIDDTQESGALVPEKFRQTHWARVPAGEPSPEFLRQMQEMGVGRAR
jgi:hypothetical protein